MSNLTGVDIQGLTELVRGLEHLPQEAKDAAGDAGADYVLEVMKLYPPKKSVSRKQAYGVTFFSDVQRRTFFGKLRRGEISVPHRRTQGLAKSWKIIGKGEKSIVVSESKAAVYTVSNQQSRHEALVGWEKIDDNLKKRAEKLNKRLEGAAKKALKKAGFK